MANKPTSDSIQKLKNLSADQSVNPTIPREGIMGKASDGSWYNVAVNTDGELVVAESGGVSDALEGAPVTVGTTAVELTFSGTTNSINIMSDHDNTGKIWWGPATVDNTGANAYGRLGAGQSVTVDLDDTSSAVYVCSDTAAQTVYKVGLVWK